MLFRLAYRNLWRNRRRTFITAASIMFAVFFATVLRSIQKGAWDHMVDSVVHFYFGYGQIHADGYWDEQTINNAFAFPTEDLTGITRVAGLTDVIPRLENFALASYGNHTKAVLLIGIDPETEDAFTHISSRISEGAMITGPDQVILAQGLAEDLGIALGDTVVFISQGYRGSNAAGKYPVTGFVNFGSPDLNDRLAYIALPSAQYFFRAENLVTSLVLGVENKETLPAVLQSIKARIDTSQYEVLGYEELLPDLMEAREFDEAGSVIILIILYAIIAFGVFGTILMMLKEREYEFGILKAIGMRSRQITLVVWIEMMFLALIGAMAGMLLALPIVSYLTHHPIRFQGEMAEAYEKFGVEPIMPAIVDGSVFLNQAIVVVILVMLMMIFPLLKIKHLKPMQALHH